MRNKIKEAIQQKVDYNVVRGLLSACGFLGFIVSSLTILSATVMFSSINVEQLAEMESIILDHNTEFTESYMIFNNNPKEIISYLLPKYPKQLFNPYIKVHEENFTVPPGESEVIWFLRLSKGSTVKTSFQTSNGEKITFLIMKGDLDIVNTEEEVSSNFQTDYFYESPGDDVYYFVFKKKFQSQVDGSVKFVKNLNIYDPSGYKEICENFTNCIHQVSRGSNEVVLIQAQNQSSYDGQVFQIEWQRSSRKLIFYISAAAILPFGLILISICFFSYKLPQSQVNSRSDLGRVVLADSTGDDQKYRLRKNFNSSSENPTVPLEDL